MSATSAPAPRVRVGSILRAALGTYRRRFGGSPGARSACSCRFWLTFLLVPVPLVLEHELIAAVEHLDVEREYLVVLGLHAVLALGVVVAVVALVQVTLAFELARRHPGDG